MLHNAGLERPARDQHSGLFDPFLSYEEYEVLWIQPLELYSQPFIFLSTYKWAQYARVLHIKGLEGLPWINTLTYLVHF